MEPKNQSAESIQGEEGGDVAPSSTDYDEIDTVEKWHYVVHAIESTTKGRFPGSPPSDAASGSDFQRYWRDAFTQLSNSISSDSTVPGFLTCPPTRKFSVFIFDLGQKGCPCCLPETSPNIVVENEDGVTKDDFMKAFTDYMYGGPLPRVNHEDGSQASGGICALVYGSNWMSQGKNADGEKLAMLQMVAPKDRIPEIWLFCSDSDGYLEKTAAKISVGVGQA
ncbi:hypothetical protein B0T10DRAFT_498879 [Thelonectria olida]|uniref:Uncharacterized protein n=1 Tax=Thelonectria olida TaxID=1576542 RepID=A0A9P8VUK9_9HYPO|nr:hypothetical protein B0T10DRAFT_498879 [Thelonectria olida]